MSGPVIGHGKYAREWVYSDAPASGIPVAHVHLHDSRRHARLLCLSAMTAQFALMFLSLV
jgi:hypothetical protein